MGSNVSSPKGRNGNSNNAISNSPVPYSPSTPGFTPQRMQKKPIKILLLGAGGSGKSTFLKQLRVLKGEPFASDDIRLFRELIFGNLIGGVRDLSSIIEEKNIKVSEGVREHFLAIEDADGLRNGELFPDSLQGHFKALWEDPSMQEAWEYGKNTALSENLPYFFSSIDRLFGRSYVPSEQDIMRYSVRTIGISETEFKVYDYPALVVDVGGQRNERKKWVHFFENATCVVFSVNLNGYDQLLVENNHVNEMEEALTLWDSISGTHWFLNCSIVLLLNKFDLFEQKVQTSDIKAFFPDFKGPAKDADAGYRYFKKRFSKLAKERGRVGEKAVYIFAVSTTDTSMLRKLMPTIKNIIINSYHSLDLM